jgi:hypothetical protein
MTDKWRKEIRYSITKNGKFYNQYEDQETAIKKCRELENDGFEVTIKAVKVEVMPLKELNSIFSS